jgi:hypothetical protein
MEQFETVTLRDYFERVLDERQRAVELQFSSAQRALGLASEAAKAHDIITNQFREQLTEERALYLRREQLEPLFLRLDVLERDRANLQGKLWALGVAFSTVTGLLTFLANYLIGK